MFRRIEVIDGIADEHYDNFVLAVKAQGYTDKRDWQRYWKGGLLCTCGTPIDAGWIEMPNPRRCIRRNVRFYFTEKGWKEYGRKTVELCQKEGQQYRVIKIKEKPVDAVYRDEIQVAVRPRKKKNTRRRDKVRINNYL